MSAAFIEHRPLSSNLHTETQHHAVVSGGKEVYTAATQTEAVTWARSYGYSPIHVARERHLQNRDVPDHWRKY